MRNEKFWLRLARSRLEDHFHYSLNAHVPTDQTTDSLVMDTPCERDVSTLATLENHGGPQNYDTLCAKELHR